MSNNNFYKLCDELRPVIQRKVMVREHLIETQVAVSLYFDQNVVATHCDRMRKTANTIWSVLIPVQYSTCLIRVGFSQKRSGFKRKP